jgi:hypothetical protein
VIARSSRHGVHGRKGGDGGGEYVELNAVTVLTELSGIYVLNGFSSHDPDKINLKYNKTTATLLVLFCDETLGSPGGSAHDGPVLLKRMDAPKRTSTAVRWSFDGLFLFRARDCKVVLEPLECRRHVIVRPS